MNQIMEMSLLKVMGEVTFTEDRQASKNSDATQQAISEIEGAEKANLDKMSEELLTSISSDKIGENIE